MAGEIEESFCVADGVKVAHRLTSHGSVLEGGQNRNRSGAKLEGVRQEAEAVFLGPYTWEVATGASEDRR